MNRHQRRARLKAIRTEMGEIQQRTGDTAFSAEDQARWNTLSTEATELNAREDREAELDELDRRAAGTPLNGEDEAARRPEVRAFTGVSTRLPQGFDGATMRAQDGTLVPVLEHRHRFADFLPAGEQRGAEIGLGGFLRAMAMGPRNDAERRALAEATIGTGGALVPAPLAAEVIDLLRARSVAFRAGARTIPMTSQTLDFARVVADPVGGWRAENAPIAEGQPAFDRVRLVAKSWALLVKVSRELLEDGQNTDAQLRGVIARAGAAALDQAILFGTGTTNQPLGIRNQPGVINLGSAHFESPAGWASVLDAVSALEMADAGDITAMVAHPRTARQIYGMADTTGQPLQIPRRIADVPLLTSTAVPITEGTNADTSPMILGDWREVFVGMRTELQISVLQERFADNGQVAFVAWLRADVALARANTMAVLEGFTE